MNTPNTQPQTAAHGQNVRTEHDWGTRDRAVFHVEELPEFQQITAQRDELLKELKVAKRHASNILNRLQGKSRPHPNDLEWAKEIAETIEKDADAAITKAEQH